MTVNQKMLITFIVGLLVGAGAVWLWYAKGGTEENTENMAATSTMTTSETSALPGGEVTTASAEPVTGGAIAVEDQPAGTLVTIASLTMPRDGWVAIHEDVDGTPGSILGAQRYDAGLISSPSVTLLRGMTAGKQYYAVLHADNGDRAFDPHTDLPMQSADGKQISATFLAK